MRNLLPVTIAIPPIPIGAQDLANKTRSTLLPVISVPLYLWKLEHAKAQDQMDKYNQNMAKAYIIIYHQCLPMLKNDLEASNMFATICSNQDVIALLKLVQSLCCLYDAKTQGVTATVALHKRLFTHYLKDNVKDNVDKNHTYHHEFLAHVETLETNGGVGVVGVVPTFLAAKIKERPTLTATSLDGWHKECRAE
jgi:hypothetical protein